MAGNHSMVRCAVQTSIPHGRLFHAQAPCHASILFALHALSNSRETQHFNKLSRLQRIEHSPALKLIKTGEIDPLKKETKPAPTSPTHSKSDPEPRTRSPVRIWDDKALHAGRAILTDNARAINRMSRALERAATRAQKSRDLFRSERETWAKERESLQQDLRIAIMWILISMASATGLAMWRFWPDQQAASLDNVNTRGKHTASWTESTAPLERSISPWSQSAAPQASLIEPEKSAGINASSVTPPPADTIRIASSPRSWWAKLLWA